MALRQYEGVGVSIDTAIKRMRRTARADGATGSRKSLDITIKLGEHEVTGTYADRDTLVADVYEQAGISASQHDKKLNPLEVTVVGSYQVPGGSSASSSSAPRPRGAASDGYSSFELTSDF